MKKVLFLDIFSGISGDMFIGAMLDLGVEFEWLESQLSKLHLDGYSLSAERKDKSNIFGYKFDVHLDALKEKKKKSSDDQKSDQIENHHSYSHDHSHSHSHSHDHSHSHSHRGGHLDHGRTFSIIRELVAKADYSDWVKTKATSIFQRVADAEGKVHGLPPDKVHFHEVGAVDSIIDIIGACLCLEKLGCPEVHCGPVVEGHGWVDCAHGRFPIPTAATLEILSARGVALDQCEEPNELVTPTGAAIICELAQSFGRMKGISTTQIGYGLGTRDNQTRPNVLRACIGEKSVDSPEEKKWNEDEVYVLESNIDDCSPEFLGDFYEKAMELGALDIAISNITMKKNRPGFNLQVITDESKRDLLAEAIFKNTSAIGMRVSKCSRYILKRILDSIETPLGKLEVKKIYLGGKLLQISPEFESAKKLADLHNVSINTIYSLCPSSMTKDKGS